MPIKTIIFDFGDVLVTDTAKITERQYHFDRLPKTKQRKYIKAFYDADLGKISGSQLLATINEVLGTGLSVPALREKILQQTKLMKPWQLISKLRSNYQIIIFSNNQLGWPQRVSKHLGISLRGLDFINSAKVGLKKPDHKFYQYLIKRFRIKPEEAIFIDDKEKNLAPARKLGIHTFLYSNNYQELTKFLKKQSIKGL
jgi:epoxide hydrolase-like predicted phosphatase